MTIEPFSQWFKLVAVEMGDSGEKRHVSIYDGLFEYHIGEAVSEEVRGGHQGGIYVCRSVLDLREFSKCHPFHSNC